MFRSSAGRDFFPVSLGLPWQDVPANDGIIRRRKMLKEFAMRGNYITNNELYRLAPFSAVLLEALNFQRHTLISHAGNVWFSALEG